MTEPLRKSTSTPTSSREGKSTGDDAAGARTAEASTQTAMSSHIPMLVIASCTLVGNGVSYCLYHLIESLLTPCQWELILSKIGATRIGAVGCVVTFWYFGSMIFDLGVGLYLAGLRVSGLLDHRSARLLAATNPEGKFRSSLTGRRYRGGEGSEATRAAGAGVGGGARSSDGDCSTRARHLRPLWLRLLLVMDGPWGEENAHNYAQNYAEDEAACGDRLAHCWWAHCALGSLIGAYFCVMPMVS